MRRAQILAALAGTGMLVTVSAAAASPDSRPVTNGSVHREAISFVYDEPFNGGTTKFVNQGKHRLGAGDMFFTTGVPMWARGTQDRIGVVDGTETIVSGKHHGTVDMNMTLRLDGGLVMVSGVVRHTDKPFALPVVGGTGAYAHATGQLSEVREDDQAKVTIIKVELVV